jgi:hypothetical protein
MRTYQEKYRDKIAKSLKEVGKWIENNANELATGIEGRVSMDIWIRYKLDVLDEITPSVSVTYDYIAKKAVEEMMMREQDD